jgi:hypothetical protein
VADQLCLVRLYLTMNGSKNSQTVVMIDIDWEGECYSNDGSLPWRRLYLFVTVCSPEFLKFIGPRGQKIMRSANNVGNAGPHVRQTFLNDVFTFLSEAQVVL